MSVAALLLPVKAGAQSCCAGGGAYQPARLKIFEDALVGLQLKVAGQLGSFDAQSNYIKAPSGTSELDLEQDVVGSLRLSEGAQLGLQVPLIETRRAVPELSELGGGLGDLSLTGRYDFLRAGDSKIVPGIALLVGITFPTGRPPESATTPLATGSTGTGAWQGALGASFEQLFGPVVVNATAQLSGSLPRSVDGLTEQLGLRFAGLLAGGYAFKNGSALALTLSYSTAGEATLDGQQVPGSDQRQLTAGLAGGRPINDTWRVQGSIFYDLPVLGRNHLADVGASVMLLRTWF